MLLQTLKDATPEVTSGILVVAFLSCLLFALKQHFALPEAVFSVGASVFMDGEAHRVLSYPFYHRTAVQLLVSVVVLMLLCGSFERGVGTVRFLFLFLMLSTCTGLCYALLDLFLHDTTPNPAEGLVPTALALVAVTTVHTRMAKGFFCGVSVPTASLPWVFLIVTFIFVPHTVLPCNIIAILVGWVYGKGWLSVLDMSEARASLLEKVTPFRFLRNIPGVRHVPASPEERRKTLLPETNPTPGSYPVQAYAPAGANAMGHTATPQMYEGWPNATSASGTGTTSTPQGGCRSEMTGGHTTAHSCNHSHGPYHSHEHL
ncbi:Rhomboid domain-containing protein 2 [Merluccius polli]|uniref:Rhomboid domain-containing protein 2 n=1 Tax=Merluccius polli TaxID=89951 RepID=A0AA47NTE8_MERPO|nr:Rhomboid domain-containing protein 2 [Merluccius polli]